jgi:hypothetical protein
VSEKGNSPFYPSHPVPPDFFVGRQSQLDRIMQRGVGQVERGKMVPIFVQGEYGIGKTSLARSAQQAAQVRNNLHPIYCSLGGCRSLADVVSAVFEATVRSRALDSTKAETISNLFAKYVGKQNLFGVLTLLESEDYRSILKKIASGNPSQMKFSKADLDKGLTVSEKSKLNNFLQKMRKLKVVRSGDRREYIFNMRMVRLYIWLQFDPVGQVVRKS